MSVQSTHYKAKIKGQTWFLLPQKAVYWEEEEMLLVTDLHLGKAGHFRKHGIPISGNVTHHDIKQLEKLTNDYAPKRILILGDLFHSTYNEEWEYLVKGITKLRAIAPIEIELVLGNHDILGYHRYKNLNLTVYPQDIQIGPFWFTHHPLSSAEELPKDAYAICGHVHPGVQLRGLGRQRLNLPCFYFGSFQGILPAFGQFTGLHMIQARHHDRIFAIAENTVICLND